MTVERPIVFVVDDDPSVCEALRRLITSVGLDVEAFPTAQAFQEARRHRGPSCLVLDVRLPGLSGLDLQEALASMDAALPIIFLTGQGDIPTTVHAMRRGAEDFLTKMAPAETLLAAIERELA